ncbi:MAG: hypothetical protein ACYCUM_03500 [Solirubrobacteraceae bacterium]
MTRIWRAWQGLDHERRLAACAAVGIVLSMLLPWYQQNGVIRGVVVSRDLSAFGVFSLLEGLVLLTALSVLALLFAVAERRELPIPGMESALVLGGGAFAALLLVIRLFDKPGVSGNGAAVDVGVQWGIFFALAAAGLLLYAGARMRTTDGEPPSLRGRGGWSGSGAGGWDGRSGGGGSWSGPGSGADSWSGRSEPTTTTRSERFAARQRARARALPLGEIPPRSEVIDVTAEDAEPLHVRDARPRTSAARRRPRPVPPLPPEQPSDQLSFEDDAARP